MMAEDKVTEKEEPKTFHEVWNNPNEESLKWHNSIGKKMRHEKGAGMAGDL